MANEIQPFNYGEIEPATAEKLKRHATAIRGIQSKAIYEIGEELQSAHDELADHNGGTFYAWCESIGIGRDTVQRILRYHEFVAANCGNRELLESLPKSLIYEASKKSTPQELKDKVASGDVTTLPEFKKLKSARRRRRPKRRRETRNPSIRRSTRRTSHGRTTRRISRSGLTRKTKKSKSSSRDLSRA